MDEISGFISREEMVKTTENANRQSGYSKEFVLFKPIDIQMLIDLSEIEPSIEEFGDESDIKKDEICQMLMTPDGRLSIGKFNEDGNGTSYYRIEDKEKIKEGVHFIFC